MRLWIVYSRPMLRLLWNKPYRKLDGPSASISKCASSIPNTVGTAFNHTVCSYLVMSVMQR